MRVSFCSKQKIPNSIAKISQFLSTSELQKITYISSIIPHCYLNPNVEKYYHHRLTGRVVIGWLWDSRICLEHSSLDISIANPLTCFKFNPISVNKTTQITLFKIATYHTYAHILGPSFSALFFLLFHGT